MKKLFLANVDIRPKDSYPYQLVPTKLNIPVWADNQDEVYSKIYGYYDDLNTDVVSINYINEAIL